MRDGVLWRKLMDGSDTRRGTLLHIGTLERGFSLTMQGLNAANFPS